MAIKLTQGTKEIIPVDVVDTSGVVTDLSTATPKFWFQRADESYVYDNVAASAVGMRINCLVDTSASGPDGLLPTDELLRLFVGFTNGSEVIKLGPVGVYMVNTP